MDSNLNYDWLAGSFRFFFFVSSNVRKCDCHCHHLLTNEIGIFSYTNEFQNYLKVKLLAKHNRSSKLVVYNQFLVAVCVFFF